MSFNPRELTVEKAIFEEVGTGLVDSGLTFKWNTGINYDDSNLELQIRVNWDQPILSSSIFFSSSLCWAIGATQFPDYLKDINGTWRDKYTIYDLSRLTMEGRYSIMPLESGSLPAEPKYYKINSAGTIEASSDNDGKIVNGNLVGGNAGGGFCDSVTGENIPDPGGYYAFAVVQRDTGLLDEISVLQQPVAPHM